ncbi:MAG: glycosyltransferase family 4 protein [Pseudomonadota bacterium]
MTTSTVLILITAFLFTMTLSGIILRFAGKLKLIDIPNERSSHSIPVPRGGGIAIACVFLALLPSLPVENIVSLNLTYAIFGSGVIIALLGFMDDRSHIPAYNRLVIHFLAAIWVIYFLFMYSNPPLAASGDLYWWTFTLLLIISLVWLLNLYNFMDGIDAITGSETISVSLCASLLTWQTAPGDPSWIILLLLASAVAGFLVWNLPPAKLFMGDSGSAFLGIVLGCLMIYSTLISSQLFYAWLILLGVYIVDANVTLIRRILAGQKFYEAHRSHAYQHAAKRYHSHGKVSLAVVIINLLWLLPIATSVTLGLLDGPFAIAIAYLPLIWVSLYFKAGNSHVSAT